MKSTKFGIYGFLTLIIALNFIVLNSIDDHNLNRMIVTNKSHNPKNSFDDPIYIDSFDSNNDWDDCLAISEGDGSRDNPYVLRDLNIIVNGPEIGINIQNGNSHLIIKNCSIESSPNSPYHLNNIGIQVSYSSNITIQNCSISNNGENGISLLESSHINLTQNIFNFNDEIGLGSLDSHYISLEHNIFNSIFNGNGIELEECSNYYFYNNSFKNCEITIYQSLYLNFSSLNVINDKNLSYYERKDNSKIDGTTINVGYLIINNCSDLQIEKFDISSSILSIHIVDSLNCSFSSNNFSGIYLNNCTAINITKNNINNSGKNGISIENSQKIDVEYNNISSPMKSGIFTFNANNITIFQNNISNFIDHGIVIQDSGYLNITKNIIFNGILGCGIISDASTNITIIENKIFSLFNGIGILLSNTHFSQIMRNRISKNFRGIDILSDSFQNNISYNIIFNNLELGVNLDGEGNSVINNLIFNNNDLVSGELVSIPENNIFYNNTLEYQSLIVSLHIENLYLIQGEIIQFYHVTSGGFKNLSFFWDFGDGTNSTLSNPIHKYENFGEFAISLTVSDSAGFHEISHLVIEIEEDLMPEAQFNFDSEIFYDYVVFRCIPNNIQGNGILNYYWDFGDGTNSTLSNPTHFYENVGIFNISLFVVDYDGDNSTLSKNITVQENIYHTNHDWQSIEIGTNTFTCREQYSQLWMDAVVVSDVPNQIQFSYFNLNPTLIKLPDEFKISAYYHIALQNLAHLPTYFSVNFYYPNGFYSNSELYNLALYKFDGTNWIELNGILGSKLEYISINDAEFEIYYALGLSSSYGYILQEGEKNDDNNQIISAFPVIFMLISSITAVFFINSKNSSKLR